MSRAIVVPISRANSSALASGTGAEQVPSFENPDNFQQSPGNEGYWFCISCKPFPHTGLHIYNATLAIKHEKSHAHKDALKQSDSWGASRVDGWGYDWGKETGLYENLQYDMEREKVPPKKRVKCWIKDMAKAEGIEIDEEDDDDDELPGDTWDDWASAKNDWGSRDDWMSHKPWDECLPRSWVPAMKRTPATKRTPTFAEVDPQAAADFKFVEKVAKARGIAQESKRLHYFYRLPTEEKIHRIQEIVHFISCH